jgi:hypothetical protein
MTLPAPPQRANTELSAAQLQRLAAAITDPAAADYVRIRAIVAAADERDDRLARLTSMGREFIAGVRRCVRYDGVGALLADPPTLHERVLESATRQIVAADGRDLVTMQRLARDAAIPRRTLYNMYSAHDLTAACRRRAQTIWRARFEHAVLGAGVDPKRRLFAVIEALDSWVASERFRADQILCARPSFTQRLQDDDLREHLAEIDRFATALGAAARLASPAAFGAFVAASVAGAAGWFDRRAAARAAGVGFVERELARRR